MSRRKRKSPSRAVKKTGMASFAETGRRNLPTEARTLIASARNDITIPWFSGVLRNQDDTLIQQGGGKGLAIYDEIERDTHAYAMLQKRKKAVIARSWQVEPGGDAPIDAEAVDMMRDILTALPFDRICEDLLDATLKGFAVSEVIWERDGDLIVPRSVNSHDPRRFVFDEDWQPRLLTMAAMRDGIALPPRKFITHRVGVKGNNPYGLGLGTRLFWAVLFKREGVAFWLHFLEKFAGPTVIGKTPWGMLSDQQAQLLRTLEEAKTASAVTVPIGTDIEFLEATRSGSVTYEQWLDYWDRQISICVTGETLTTQVDAGGGSRALGEVHQDIFDQLTDGDASALSDTLRDSLLRWIMDYNLPGAAVPSVVRIRASNEKAASETRLAKAQAAEATDTAIRTIVEAAASFDDDQAAREYIVSFDITDQLSDHTIDTLVAGRHSFARKALTPAMDGALAFADRAQKKSHDNAGRHVCFAEPGGLVGRLTEAALAATGTHFDRRLGAIRKAVANEDIETARRNLLELAARWSPDALARQIGDVLELAALEGREAVLAKADGSTDAFAAEGIGVTFREQIDFLRQKRAMPTRAWMDAMHGVHDRAFVIAGATDLAMLDEFQQALIDTIPTRDIESFGRVFDALVEKYGWSYNGGRDWRVRTIFETNVRTSYMAGRLAQMRDPDMVKARPFWQYVHADTRIPVAPREQHVAWDGLILAWDDPWWDTHYPPNGWKCSCGVRPLSQADLDRMGKTGPDKAPPVTRNTQRRRDGSMVEVTDGIEYGWDYQPGTQWAQGLIPEQIEAEAAPLGKQVKPSGAMPQIVSIDDAEPLTDLMAGAREFQSELLKPGAPPEDYIRRFLHEFGATFEQPALWEDQAGGRIVIGNDLFRRPDGTFKLQRGRDQQILRLAEALKDPDEIWLGVRARRTGLDDPLQHFTTRRFIRVSPDYGVMMMFELGARQWAWVTGFAPAQDGSHDLNYLDALRVGRLLYKRRSG